MLFADTIGCLALKYLIYANFYKGGREVDGVLKGYDKLDNLVLDDCIEFIRGK